MACGRQCSRFKSLCSVFAVIMRCLQTTSSHRISVVSQSFPEQTSEVVRIGRLPTENHIQNVLNQLRLQRAITRRGAVQRWIRIHLDQPRFHLVIDQNVVAEAFEEIAATVNDRLYGFQRMPNYR